MIPIRHSARKLNPIVDNGKAASRDLPNRKTLSGIILATCLFQDNTDKQAE
jgi:hypothetical protein